MGGEVEALTDAKVPFNVITHAPLDGFVKRLKPEPRNVGRLQLAGSLSPVPLEMWQRWNSTASDRGTGSRPPRLSQHERFVVANGPPSSLDAYWQH